jgi:hypothetical protein
MMRLVPRLSLMILLLAMTLPVGAACPDAPTFTPAHYPASGTDPFVGFVRDVNGDGREDLVVFYNSTSGFQVFLGTARGTLQSTPVQFVADMDAR